MDKNEGQKDQGQEKQQKSTIDRLNQGINTVKDAKSAYKISKRFANKLKGAKTTSKGFALAGRGGQLAVRVVTTLASTVEIWGPIALIVGFFVLVIIAVIVIFTGVQTPPACKSLTADKTTINKDNPVTLSLVECSENVTYSWVLPQIGGSFSTPQSQTTIYTPPDLNKDARAKISVSVCTQANAQNCSQYSINLNISYAPPSYPGITYRLKGPNDCSDPCRVKKGELVTFNIDITYDETKAAPIENVSAVAGLSTAVFTINSISGKTTAEFNPNFPLIKYLWNLSENNSTTESGSRVKNFNFKINLTPHVNNVETSIALDMLIKDAP